MIGLGILIPIYLLCGIVTAAAVKAVSNIIDYDEVQSSFDEGEVIAMTVVMLVWPILAVAGLMFAFWMALRPVLVLMAYGFGVVVLRLKEEWSKEES